MLYVETEKSQQSSLQFSHENLKHLIENKILRE